MILRTLLPCILFLFYNSNALAQVLHAPDEYSQYITSAESLAATGKYKEAITFYQRAFHAFGGRLTRTDRYNFTRTFSLSGDADSTVQHLKKLCTAGEYWDYPTLLKDPAFNNVRSHPGFAEAIECMKTNKQKFAPNFNYAWRDLLDSLHQHDQAIRAELTAARKAKADITVISGILRRMEAVSTANVSAISDILDNNGLPGYDVVDLKGVGTILLIIQHAPIDVQVKYLPLVKQGLKEKKVQPYELAMLEDRVSVAQTGTQIYGSQVFTEADGRHQIIPIVDEVNVNKRRAEVGLGPLEDYLKLFGIHYTPLIKK